MTDQKRINELEKNYAVMDNKMSNISDIVLQIRDNHLVHIKSDIKDLQTAIDKNFLHLDKKIQDLMIVDAKQVPTNNILNKVIEYIIIAVVGAGVALLISRAL